MPALEPTHGDARVLVTGANGYIATWVIRSLLEQGYAVRGTVRSVEKGEGLPEPFSSWGEKFEWVVVDDITREGAFDEAVKDVVAVLHIASPVAPQSDDPEDYIQPAIRGTLGVLLSALKFGATVRRIVITSSCLAIQKKVTTPDVVFDETSWADDAISVVQEHGSNAPMVFKYRAAKTLAERAAWDFYNSNKRKIGWDLVALNPSLVIGPTLQAPKSPNELNESLKFWFYNVFTESGDQSFKYSYACVDVRDVAAAHVMALRKEAAGGERLIVSEGALTWQETRKIAGSMFPKLYEAGILPRGNPSQKSVVLYDYDSRKGKEILGLKYRNVPQIVGDTVTEFENRGWLDSPVIV